MINDLDSLALQDIQVSVPSTVPKIPTATTKATTKAKKKNAQ